MDSRKITIRDLENKIRADKEARDKLFEGLGEILLERIAGDDPFNEENSAVTAAETPGSILAEYRRMQKDIAESTEKIKSLEWDISRLQELEGEISETDKKKTRLEEEHEEALIRFGKALLEDPNFHDAGGASRKQEESLLTKIEEQESKLDELEGREGSILSRLSRSAQMTFSRTLISKNHSALQRLYRGVGEKNLIAKSENTLEGESTEAAESARELDGFLSSVLSELNNLKEERRKLAGAFGTEASPARRITGFEKHIAHVTGSFPSVYRRFGQLTAEKEWQGAFSSLIKKDDKQVLKNAGLIANEIAEKEMEIKKINAAIRIDIEQGEIEKMGKAIQVQQLKIASAENAIKDLERQIVETTQHIEELKGFIQENGGIQENHGSED